MTTNEVHRPGHLAGGVLTMAILMVPKSQRDRYDDEFRADLYLVNHGRQLPHALGVLAGTLALRRAIHATDAEAAARSVTYWRCRLGRHHYTVVNDDNPENRKSTHRECTRCLKSKKDNTEFEKEKVYGGNGAWIGM